MPTELKALAMFVFGVLYTYLALRACRQGLKTGLLPIPDRFNLMPRPNRQKNSKWFWLNFSMFVALGLVGVLLISWSLTLLVHIGLTPSSTRTPPALSSALSQHFAFSASLIASVQAWPVSLVR